MYLDVVLYGSIILYIHMRMQKHVYVYVEGGTHLFLYV